MKHADRKIHDLLIIGGGINGAGIARDAAGRGYRVCLCDTGDFGGATSAASTKLIHGGLRYLEYYKFRLVREALQECEILWQNAPHIIRPLRFVLPYHKGLRPRWLLRLGLYIYDHLGERKLLPKTRSLNLTTDPAGKPLKQGFTHGFAYSDCWVEDSRLVILNLRDAAKHGAKLYARTRASKAEWQGDHWLLTLQSPQGSKKIRTRLVINASGPWVDEVLQQVFGCSSVHNVRLVRGSHLIINKKLNHKHCYILQNSDGRILFAIPYEKNYTLLGTTDVEHKDIHQTPVITTEETAYLCAMANEYFADPVTSKDIVWSYSGVRPLYDDGASEAQEATRDYVITDANRHMGQRGSSLLNIFGGKITTYRRLAETVLEWIESTLGARKPAWTSNTPLPGGDFALGDREKLLAKLVSDYPFLSKAWAKRLFTTYGREAWTLLGKATSDKDLGEVFDPDSGQNVTANEVDFLLQHEFAQTAEDILWRRTKLGLHLNESAAKAIDAYISASAVDRVSTSVNKGVK